MAFIIIIGIIIIAVVIVTVVHKKNEDVFKITSRYLNPETVNRYISDHYVEEKPEEAPNYCAYTAFYDEKQDENSEEKKEDDGEVFAMYSLEMDDASSNSDLRDKLFDSLAFIQEPFGKRLNSLLGLKGISSSAFCRDSMLSRAWLSNVTTNNVNPTKGNALAACIGLKLNLNEATELLKCAGYTFSNSDITDIVVQCYIEYGVYNIDGINSFLLSKGCKPLGSKN